MKKILTLVTIAAIPLFTQAQDSFAREFNQSVFNTCATIAVIVLFMVFILAVMKKIMEHRIKNKIVDKGIPENLALSILQTKPEENGNDNIKWFSLLFGLGTALTIIYYTLPLGIHSLAIMAFSLAGSFLGYYLLSKALSK